MIEVSEPEDGSSHTLPLGEELVIRLQENATTGYRWEFSQSGPGALDQREDTLDHRPGAAGAPGSGGQRTIRFVGKQRGRVRVEARLRRSWEPAAAGARTVAYSIDIV